MSLVLGLTAAAPGVYAQTPASLQLDPQARGQGTTLLIGIDGPALSRSGSPPTSLTLLLPRGMRVDTRARAQVCRRDQAARARCPKASRIGFGRQVTAVSGYLSPGGETNVAWSIAAYLGTPVKPADAASIVLRAALLGSDRVDQLLRPFLREAVPSVSVTTARLVPTRSGPYGLEARFGGLPGELRVPASMTAAPARLDLAVGALRRVRRNFVRLVKVRTLTGHRTDRIRDHTLVGYDLLRNPARCAGGWPWELKVGFAGAVERRNGRIDCAGEE